MIFKAKNLVLIAFLFSAAPCLLAEDAEPAWGFFTKAGCEGSQYMVHSYVKTFFGVNELPGSPQHLAVSDYLCKCAQGSSDSLRAGFSTPAGIRLECNQLSNNGSGMSMGGGQLYPIAGDQFPTNYSGNSPGIPIFDINIADPAGGAGKRANPRQADTFGSTAFTRTVPVRQFGLPPLYADSQVTPTSRCNDAVNPTAYAIDPIGRVLSRYNLCTGRLTADLNVPPNSTQIAVTPNGKWALIASFDPAISFVDTDTNRLVRTIPMPALTNPFGITITRDSAYALVTNVGNGAGVWVVDIAGQRVDGMIRVDRSFPQSVAVSPDGTLIWVAFPLDNVVEVIDLMTGTLNRAIIAPAASDIVFNPTGTVAYVANGSINGSVLAIDTKTYSVIKTIPTGAGAGELSLSPDGGILTVNNLFADSVSVIDTATLTAVTTRGPGQPYKAVAAPVQ